MKAKSTVSFRVTPTNIKTGATAPSYVFDYQPNPNMDLKKLAQQEAQAKSRLSDFDAWSFEVEKV